MWRWLSLVGTRLRSLPPPAAQLVIIAHQSESILKRHYANRSFDLLLRHMVQWHVRQNLIDAARLMNVNFEAYPQKSS